MAVLAASVEVAILVVMTGLSWLNDGDCCLC